MSSDLSRTSGTRRRGSSDLCGTSCARTRGLLEPFLLSQMVLQGRAMFGSTLGFMFFFNLKVFIKE